MNITTSNSTDMEKITFSITANDYTKEYGGFQKGIVYNFGATRDYTCNVIKWMHDCEQGICDRSRFDQNDVEIVKYNNYDCEFDYIIREGEVSFDKKVTTTTNQYSSLNLMDCTRLNQLSFVDQEESFDVEIDRMTQNRDQINIFITNPEDPEKYKMKILSRNVSGDDVYQVGNLLVSTIADENGNRLMHGQPNCKSYDGITGAYEDLAWHDIVTRYIIGCENGDCWLHGGSFCNMFPDDEKCNQYPELRRYWFPDRIIIEKEEDGEKIKIIDFKNDEYKNFDIYSLDNDVKIKQGEVAIPGIILIDIYDENRDNNNEEISYDDHIFVNRFSISSVLTNEYNTADQWFEFFAKWIPECKWQNCIIEGADFFDQLFSDYMY